MTVRATVPINKGEQIFASYTMPLEGNLMKPYPIISKFTNIFGLYQEQKSGELFYVRANYSIAIVPVAQIRRNIRLTYLPSVAQSARPVSFYLSIRWMTNKRIGNALNVLTFLRLLSSTE